MSTIHLKINHHTKNQENINLNKNIKLLNLANN